MGINDISKSDNKILSFSTILQFQFGFNMFPDIPRPFIVNYQCYSVAMLPGNERQDVERGGKSKSCLRLYKFTGQT